MRNRIAFDRMIPVLMVMMVLMWVMLSYLTGISFYGPSAYNTYTLQTLSWLHGHVAVEDVQYLELAIYNGSYYVSFPPVPSVVLLPFALIFGSATPDNLLVKIYACAAVILIYRALCRKGFEPAAAAPFAFLFAFSSSLLTLTVEGAVWYHAQTLAFVLTVASVFFLTCDYPTLSLVTAALSVGCRPFNALYLIPIFLIYITVNIRSGVTFGKVLRRLLPGIGAGLLIAAAYGTYNYIRFQDPFEFGHNYLPEFSTQGGVQFSPSHVLTHINPFLIGLPFTVINGTLYLQKFGFSAFIACPVLLFLVCWFFADLFKGRMTVMKAVVFVTFLVHFFLLLMHRTFGAFQYGARYCVDLIPYVFLYLLLGSKRQVRLPEWIYLLLTFGLAFYGSMVIHL